MYSWSQILRHLMPAQVPLSSQLWLAGLALLTPSRLEDRWASPADQELPETASAPLGPPLGQGAWDPLDSQGPKTKGHLLESDCHRELVFLH